jgi:DNA-binding response OmpR family regulator
MKNVKKVLVIDDDEIMLEGMKIALEDEGYKVETLSDNSSVEVFVQSFSPSVILIDYWMPGMNGGEITRILKTKEKTKNIPIIMISASQNAEEIAKESGADEFIAKPFDLDVLMHKVDSML